MCVCPLCVSCVCVYPQCVCMCMCVCVHVCVHVFCVRAPSVCVMNEINYYYVTKSSVHFLYKM